MIGKLLIVSCFTPFIYEKKKKLVESTYLKQKIYPPFPRPQLLNPNMTLKI